MPNKHFELRSGPGEDYRLIVFSLDAERPENYLDRVERDLIKKNFSGDLLFDLLACNGSTRRRFASVRFDGRRILRGSFAMKKPGEIQHQTESFCTAFYLRRRDKLSQTAVPAAVLHQLHTESDK